MCDRRRRKKVEKVSEIDLKRKTNFNLQQNENSQIGVDTECATFLCFVLNFLFFAESRRKISCVANKVPALLLKKLSATKIVKKKKYFLHEKQIFKVNGFCLVFAALKAFI